MAELLKDFSSKLRGWEQDGKTRSEMCRLVLEETGRTCTGGTMQRSFQKLGLTKQRSMFTPDNVSEVVEADAEAPKKSDWVHDSRYFYAESTDTYVTFLSRSKQPLVVPGDVHRAMKRAYSNWDGQPASVNRICRDYSIPRAWFTEYKTIHGWTHDSEPFSDEELVSRDEADLVSDALQQRRRAVTKKYEVERWKEVQQQADKWLRFEVEVLDRLTASIEKHAAEYTVPKIRLTRADKPFAVITCATDFHWGMYSWGKETGEAYNREIAEKRLRVTTEDLFSRLPGQPDEIILAVGSDWFHIDGDQHATTKGTPQDTDGSPAEIMVTGCELARDHINLLRQVAPVKVVLMAGNHDRSNALGLLLFLAAWFKDAVDVDVVHNFQPRVYLTYGTTLMGFHHGDQTPIAKLGTCMATECREEWGATRHHIFFGGHLHHEHVQEIGGIKHYQMPSLAGTDRYHSRKGYVDSIPGLAAYLVDKKRGVTATLFSPVMKGLS
jgi:hypothetical protein